MPDILTQDQIDKLLNELADKPEVEAAPPTAEGKRVRPYNFRKPEKLSRDQQKVLRTIGEVFARHLASYLAGMTRSYCEASVVALEEQPYKEYNNALPDMQVTGIIDVNLTKNSMLMDMSSSLTFALIERLFGGAVEDKEPPERDFTDIEIALMERIFKRITGLFKEAWSYYPDMDMTVRQIETNTRFIRAIAMDEMVMTLVLSVTLDRVKGTITFCIPCNEIMPILEAVVVEQSGNARREELGEGSEESRNAMLGNLQDAMVDVGGILGTATLSMREVLDLQPGDVIRLDQTVGTPIVITINGKEWFLGVPGTKKNKVALRINRQYAV